MANLGNTIINGILRVNGNIKVNDSVTAPFFIGTLTGNADSAINDSDGNKISTTYVKLNDNQTIYGIKKFSATTEFSMFGKATQDTLPTYDSGNLIVRAVFNEGERTFNPSIGFEEQGSSDGTLYMRDRVLYWSSTGTKTGEIPTANTGYKILHTGNFQETIGKNYLSINGGTLNGNLTFNHSGAGNPATINWNSGSVYQRMRIFDEASTDNNVFEFQQSRDSGTSYGTLMAITADNKVKATTFVGALSGNATSATKATQDSDGNAINTTYLKKTGGELTGHLYLNGITSSTTGSATKIIFGNPTTQYAVIRANDAQTLVFANSLTDNSLAIEYTPSETSFRPVTNTSLDLGSSANKWKSVYANTFVGALSGNASSATKLQTARTIGLSGVTGTAQSFDGTNNIVIPITAVPATLLTNKSSIKGSEITDDKHWVPSNDASVTNFVAMSTADFILNSDNLATGTVIAVTDGDNGYITTQATSLVCDLPLDL